jgi:O-antigen ligase
LVNNSQVGSADPPDGKSLSNRIEISTYLLFALVIGLPVSIAATHIALAGLTLFMGYRFWLNRQPFIGTPLDRPILIYLSVVLASALFGVNPGRSLIHMAALWHIALLWIVVNMVSNRTLARRLIFVMIGVGTLNALYGILQHVMGGLDLFAFGRPPRILGTPDMVRASGTFDHYMTFSGQMLMLGALGIGLLLFWAEGSTVWGLSAAVVCFLGGVITSFTRNAWLGLISAVLVIGGLKDRKAFILTAFILLVMVSILVLANPGLRERAMSIGAVKSDESIKERFKLWRIALEMIQNRPLLGVGSGNFQAEMERYREPNGPSSHSHAHNTLIEVTAENGLIGLSAYIYIWFVFFREMIRGLKPGIGSFTRGVSVGVIGGLVGFHVAGLFEYNLGDSEVNAMMWFMVGIGLAAHAGIFEKPAGLQSRAVS